MSAILSFLGGSAFRMIFGEVSSWLTKKQDAKLEIERLRVQGELDAAQHARNMTAIKLQADLGVKTIEVQAEAALNQTDAEAFRAAMSVAATPTGIKWVDAWNASIRPSYATVALLLWVASLYMRGWSLTPWDLDLCSSIAGFFFADRTLGKRGK